MNLNKQNPTDDNSLYIESKYFLDSFINAIDYIFTKKSIILFNFVASISITLIILYLTPNKYTAKSSYVSPPSDLLLSSYQDLSLSANPINISSGFNSFLKDPSEIYLQVLKSRTIRQNIIDKFNLNKEFKTVNNEYALDILLSKNVVNIVNNKGITDISVTTKSRELSANIANEYVNQLSLLLNKLNVSAAKNERTFLEKRLKEVNSSLIVLSKKLSKFQVKNKMIDIEKQGQAIISSIALLESQIIEAEAELNGLKTIYTENSPKIKAINEKILLLKSELNKIKGKKTNSSDNTLGLGINFSEIPNISINFLELARDVKIQETVFELLSKQYELAKLKEAKEQISLKIIDIAVPPIMKSFPKIKITLLAVGALSIILTLTFLFVKREIDKISLLYPDTKDGLNRLKHKILFKEIKNT
jgi:tyrosine-protein kinase Etk/Wzc